MAELFGAPDLRCGHLWFKSPPYNYSGLVLGSAEFNSLTVLCKYIANWSASCQAGFLTVSVLFTIFVCLLFQYPSLAQGRLTKIPRGRDFQKHNCLKESMMLNCDFWMGGSNISWNCKFTVSPNRIKVGKINTFDT